MSKFLQSAGKYSNARALGQIFFAVFSSGVFRALFFVVFSLWLSAVSLQVFSVWGCLSWLVLLPLLVVVFLVFLLVVFVAFGSVGCVVASIFFVAVGGRVKWKTYCRLF